ncbi:uncharacterized protein B0T15DRAFT_541541 [Chaetomium strumarium]|uniref:RING-type domain-containing protein n=1 Tax=Chaetomium strumarium TaxID=1170767 RepID=A0AAJ0GL68_9PEZI|nr:hypothetical protein B0T15DRAFT_541541 [Chaetomium strumarium]
MTDSPRPDPGPAPALAPNLEAELTCSICTDLLYQPLTLLDCLHTFCAACLKEWFHFQAERAESAPGPPPPPGQAVFTCPSCRYPVRDTKHDARVVSLVEVFLALNPGKGKSEDEKRDMDRRYTRGEKVLPRLKWEHRTEEEVRRDEEERRLIEEVQRVSLREATEEAVGRASRRGDEEEGGAGGRSSRRRRAQSAAITVPDSTSSGGERERRRRRRRSESRQPPSRGEQRQVEHQSSLRSLISTEGMDARDIDIEREIEEFARQIQEEGLLDGLDLDNLDLENNDELSRKITEAYRRRHRERRRDGGRRSNASAMSQRSDVSARPRSDRTGDASRPTSRSRHANRSRAPSAGSNEERGRYPPSSSAHLEVQEPPRRRRASSGARSATVPVVSPQQADARVGVGVRAQTDLASRSGALDLHLRRPGMGVDARSSSSPATATVGAGSWGDSPVARGLPFSARASAGLGTAAAPQPDIPSNSGSSSRQRSNRPAALDLRSESSPPATVSTVSAPVSPGVVSPPLASPPRAQLTQPAQYREPHINCNTCGQEHIEYDLHFNCAICHNGDWNICLDCWRRRKGCLHWFGFGQAAWARWEKRNLAGLPLPPPHMLTANRYLRPKRVSRDADGRRVFTTEHPADRLQSGTFCCRCAAWTNDCYWRCDVCNEGEWGFCNDCVNQGKCCTHPLLALAYRPPAAPSSPPPPAQQQQTANYSTAETQIGNFRPLMHTPPCSACRIPVPQSECHYHCYICPASGLANSEPGEYNLCETCYASLVADGTVSPENGPAGWRRCPRQGHRMAVVGFISSPDSERGSFLKRKVLRDLVGGRRLKVEEYRGQMQICSWREQGRELRRSMTKDVSASIPEGTMTMMTAEGGRLEDGNPQATTTTTTSRFPPDGGAGHRAVAGWGWIPAPGVEDELMFPKGAEIVEVEDVNGEWFHGFYMDAQGLFPAPYVRLVGR